ncbi:calmodulin [Stylonychia lemnae]|uniref:Calmodulin n=1 Tax=Stylonychia lemnae TaxID=5949 RepID=A0A078B1E4_STYLE|nr:calmodulin [Stylonychia lemnae]|eukprot:CDW87167.1 calmodulin [Stylonychia lemnae]
MSSSKTHRNQSNVKLSGKTLDEFEKLQNQILKEVDLKYMIQDNPRNVRDLVSASVKQLGKRNSSTKNGMNRIFPSYSNPMLIQYNSNEDLRSEIKNDLIDHFDSIEKLQLKQQQLLDENRPLNSRNTNQQLNANKNCPNCQYLNDTPQVNINISINIQNNTKDRIEQEQHSTLLKKRQIMTQRNELEERTDQDDKDEEQRDQVHSILQSVNQSNGKLQLIPFKAYSSETQISKPNQNTSTNIMQSQNSNANLLFENSQIQHFHSEITIPNSRHTPKRIRSKSFFDESQAKRNWLKISNAIKGINLLRRNIVKTLQDPDEIVEDIKNSPRRRRTSQLASLTSINLTRTVLDDRRNQERFFDLIEAGGEKNLKKIQQEIDEDPKRYIYDVKDPCHLINKHNRMYQTPLYVACRNGNLGVVQLLINQQADPHLKSQIDKREWESILQVTARWNHYKLYEYLLSNIKWTKQEIKEVLKTGGSKFEMLNEVQIAEIREVFTLFDKNSDGYVNTNELGTIVRGLNLNPTEAEVVEMMRDVDPNNTGSFDQNSLISLIARKGKSNETLEEMIDMLKVLVDPSDDKEKEKMKLSVEQFKFSMMNLGEKMLEHQIEEILTDSDLVFEDSILIDEFAKYIMSR